MSLYIISQSWKCNFLPIYAKNSKNGAPCMKLYAWSQKDVRETYMKFYHSTQLSSWDTAIARSRGKRLLHRIFSLFLSFYEAFFGLFSLSFLAWRKDTKFRITFLIVIWGTKKKKIFLATFMTPKFRHLWNIAWIYLASTQFWSLQHWLNTDCILPQYIKNTFKKSLSVLDRMFGFYTHF